MSQVTESPMKKISLEKVVLNMGLGKSGDVITTAGVALQQISGKKPSTRNAKAAYRDWGVRKGEPIGVAVTVRGDDATALLKRLLEAKGNTLNGKSFDNFGNFSFGINAGQIGKIESVEEGTFILPRRVILILGDKKIEIPADIIMPIGKEEPVIQLK